MKLLQSLMLMVATTTVALQIPECSKAVQEDQNEKLWANLTQNAIQIVSVTCPHLFDNTERVKCCPNFTLEEAIKKSSDVNLTDFISHIELLKYCKPFESITKRTTFCHITLHAQNYKHLLYLFLDQQCSDSNHNNLNNVVGNLHCIPVSPPPTTITSLSTPVTPPPTTITSLYTPVTPPPTATPPLPSAQDQGCWYCCLTNHLCLCVIVVLLVIVIILAACFCYAKQRKTKDGKHSSHQSNAPRTNGGGGGEEREPLNGTERASLQRE